MGKVSNLFTEVKEFYDHHAEEHPDCRMLAPEAFAITDSLRATMLTMVNEGRRAGILEPEDEVDLEIAIGTVGEPENFGWPDTTPHWQRFGVASALAMLAEALNDSKDPFDAIMEDLAGRVGGAVASSQLSSVVEALKHAHDVRSRKPETTESQDAVDWLKKGYL